MECKYIRQNLTHQKILVSPLKLSNYIPENESELFVKNLPFDSTIEELACFCEKAGEIYQIRLMMQADFVRNRGYAFVTYMNSTLATRAVRLLKKTKYRKGYLYVEKSFDNCRIFLGGIPVDKTKDEIWIELQRNRVSDIVDVIMYRSYTNRAINRGFVFVEFQTHEQAASFRARYRSSPLMLWNRQVIIDWSVPIPSVPQEELREVKKLFLRNLNVNQTPHEFKHFLTRFMNPAKMEKVFKFKNYAFVHLHTKEDAVFLMEKLKDYFKDSYVEIDWARPPDKYTTTEYRNKVLSTLGKQPARRNELSPQSSRPSTSSYSGDTSDDYSSILNPKEDGYCSGFMGQHSQYNPLPTNFMNSASLLVNQVANMTIQDRPVCLSNNGMGQLLDLYQFIGDILW